MHEFSQAVVLEGPQSQHQIVIHESLFLELRSKNEIDLHIDELEKKSNIKITPDLKVNPNYEYANIKYHEEKVEISFGDQLDPFIFIVTETNLRTGTGNGGSGGGGGGG